MTDTCPSCHMQVEVPNTGAWVTCPACDRGKLRVVPDDWPDEDMGRLDGAASRPIRIDERRRLEQLREDLAEIDGWVADGLPGAVEWAAKIRAKLAEIDGSAK